MEKEAAIDLIKTAKKQNNQRCKNPPNLATGKRLQQRKEDLTNIEKAIEGKKIKLISIYGWGNGCRIAAKPGLGISQYDTIIYEKESKIYIEKIGSCVELFRTTGVKPIGGLNIADDKGITSGKSMVYKAYIADELVGIVAHALQLSSEEIKGNIIGSINEDQLFVKNILDAVQLIMEKIVPISNDAGNSTISMPQDGYDEFIQLLQATEWPPDFIAAAAISIFVIAAHLLMEYGVLQEEDNLEVAGFGSMSLGCQFGGGLYASQQIPGSNLAQLVCEFGLNGSLGLGAFITLISSIYQLVSSDEPLNTAEKGIKIGTALGSLALTAGNGMELAMASMAPEASASALLITIAPWCMGVGAGVVVLCLLLDMYVEETDNRLKWYATQTLPIEQLLSDCLGSTESLTETLVNPCSYKTVFKPSRFSLPQLLSQSLPSGIRKTMKQTLPECPLFHNIPGYNIDVWNAIGIPVPQGTLSIGLRSNQNRKVFIDFVMAKCEGNQKKLYEIICGAKDMPKSKDTCILLGKINHDFETYQKAYQKKTQCDVILQWNKRLNPNKRTTTDTMSKLIGEIKNRRSLRRYLPPHPTVVSMQRCQSVLTFFDTLCKKIIEKPVCAPLMVLLAPLCLAVKVVNVIAATTIATMFDICKKIYKNFSKPDDIPELIKPDDIPKLIKMIDAVGMTPALQSALDQPCRYYVPRLEKLVKKLEKLLKKENTEPSKDSLIPATSSFNVKPGKEQAFIDNVLGGDVYRLLKEQYTIINRGRTSVVDFIKPDDIEPDEPGSKGCFHCLFKRVTWRDELIQQ